jgi:threonylcarbamoyladenosine tRNA methylthiotransferase MtaB
MSHNLAKFNVQTLGCKANQFDSASIVCQLTSAGLKYVGSPIDADILIINSCTVTERADYKTRQLARKWKRIDPDKIIIVTGCYAERKGEKLLEMDEIDLITGNLYKENFITAIELLNNKTDKKGSNIDFRPRDILIDFFPGMTRSLVKIQDGCDQRCSYCIVPFVRGASRSVSSDMIIRQLKHLERKGYKEAVLTGIHIGTWGTDLNGKESLHNLLKEIVSKVDIKIRLSSLEPNEITYELIDFISGHTQIRPHFHVPLQSGSPEILREMKRPYSIKDFVSVIGYITDSFEFPALGTDVIVGFPGEKEEDFKKTYRIIKELPFSYVHVFPYSERPFTAAADMPNKVSDGLKTERAKILRKLVLKKKREFVENQQGRTVEAVTFFKNDILGYVSGITDNYIPVSINGNPTLNCNIIVKLKCYNSGKVIASIVDRP